MARIQRLIPDEQLLLAARETLRHHGKYRAFAHKAKSVSRPATASLNTGRFGIQAVNAADELTTLVGLREADIRAHLPGAVTRSDVRRARSAVRSSYPKSPASWQVAAIPCQEVAVTPADLVVLVDCVHEAAEAYRVVVDRTKGLSRRLKDSARNEARALLTCRVAALHFASLAARNPWSSDHGVLGLAGLVAL